MSGSRKVLRRVRKRLPYFGWTTWILPTLAIALIGVSTWCGVQAGAAETEKGEQVTRALQIGLAAASGLLTLVLKMRNDAAERKRKADDIDARAETEMSFNDALDPLVDSLAELTSSDPDQRKEAFGSLRKQALNSIIHVLNVRRARVNYYDLMDGAATDDGKARLRLRGGSSGRAPRSRYEFVEGTPEGDHVLAQLKEDRVEFCDNVRKHPPPGMAGKLPRSYKAYLSVPCRADGVVYGMVTVDSPYKGALKEGHGDFVRVVATILAIGKRLQDTT
ncbi:GAF domain-containing protein [Cellulosimicrobium marinum]|uniref:GAF domain-containing protein n=1 Tax=Cellulosimicrobium marinum TaxID=1638992 RepID=UPI001E2C1D69|nr:GAF domain-containing protein [Cellulosimicrobium marinum]MCB7135218.1 GAF domain-containing protein [Cellulosimicrobium marinum]